MAWIVRHAATPLNHPNEQQSRVRAGGPDVPVSAAGQAQIAQIAQFFHGRSVAAVHSSDTRRAGETAHAIGKATGAPVFMRPELRPWHLGALAGHEVSKVAAVIQHLFKHPHEKAPGGGESFRDFFNRYMPAIKALLSDPKAGHVIVTHGRNVKTLMSLLKGGGHHFAGDTPPHDPRPTAPGDVYEVQPQGLVKVFSTAATPQATDRVS